MGIRYTSFPLTRPPPTFVEKIVGLFRARNLEISPASTEKKFGSNQVLHALRQDLLALGFEVEQGKQISGRIDRPVFFGESGVPRLRYQVDAFHGGWRCGLEVEAGRGFMGGAFYRDFVQAMVMIDVDHLCIAVLNEYRYAKAVSRDYSKAVSVAAAVYAHDRIAIPFGLTVIGYGPDLDAAEALTHVT